MIIAPVDWLEERSGLVGGLKYFLFRKVPAETNWFHTLGSATLTAFLVQLGHRRRSSPCTTSRTAEDGVRVDPDTSRTT